MNKITKKTDILVIVSKQRFHYKDGIIKAGMTFKVKHVDGKPIRFSDVGQNELLFDYASGILDDKYNHWFINGIAIMGEQVIDSENYISDEATYFSCTVSMDHINTNLIQEYITFIKNLCETDNMKFRVFYQQTNQSTGITREMQKTLDIKPHIQSYLNLIEKDFKQLDKKGYNQLSPQS